MARVSRFSPDVRQAAVSRAFSDGGSPELVAGELGVHPATVYRWASEDPASGRRQSSTRRRLTQAAEKLLRARGYSEITVEDVAAASGVSLRSVFHQFESKRDLFQATVDDVAAALVEEIERRSVLEPWPVDPLPRLRMFLRVGAEVTYAMPEAQVLFRDVGVPSAHGFAQRWYERFERALAQMLREAGRAGLLDPELEPDAAAGVLTQAVRGIHASVFEGADPAHAIRLVERLDRLVTPL